MAKKEKTTIWMSRDVSSGFVEFWPKQPCQTKELGRGYFDTQDTIDSRLDRVCYTHAKRILGKICLRGKGLLKLTITAERIE